MEKYRITKSGAVERSSNRHTRISRARFSSSPSSIAFVHQATKAKQVQSRSKNWRKSNGSSFHRKKRRFTSASHNLKPSGRVVAQFKNVAKNFGDKQVLKNVDFIIERGDRIALLA